MDRYLEPGQSISRCATAITNPGKESSTLYMFAGSYAPFAPNGWEKARTKSSEYLNGE